MNVLFIGTTDILGGAAKVSWDIKTALEKSGSKASMFVADKRSNDENVHVIPRQTWRKYLGFLLATENLISTDWIMKTKEFKEADIVHCHNLHGRFFNLKTLQKMSLLKPVVWTLHDEWAITPHCAYTLEGTRMKDGLYACPSIDIAPRILWNNSHRLARNKNKIYENSRLHIVTPSQWLKDRVMKTVLKKQDVMLIPNGIDTATFVKGDKAAARAKLGLPNDKKIILFLANDAKNNTWKGWKYTEEIIKQYKDRKDILFLSVGNHAAHEDESNVKYIGHMNDKKDLALYYNAADALLFTSIAENFPLVILEAMGCGLPVATFDVGGVKEAVIHRENGFIAPYKDVPKLKEGLDWLLSLSESEREKISDASAKKIQSQYDAFRMIQSYLDLYKKLHD